MTRTLEISDETYEKIKDSLKDEERSNITELADLIGKKFFFRTVTYHCTGRVVSLIGTIAQLENAAWIADSGRFADAIAKGELSEVEPVGIMYLNLQTVVDFFPWNHKLPEAQK